MFHTPVTLAHITDTNGIATHSIIMDEDDFSPQEAPMVHAPALFEGLVVMPLNLSWNTREDWYTRTDVDDDPARTLHAWESFTDRHDKPADVFLRWLTIFHPLIPAVRMTVRTGDRKSTRLNSSHVSISYAVFCLKKKNGTITCRGSRLWSRS